jgi:hypothetical protein
VLYAARSFLTNNDPKPTAELIKKPSQAILIRRAASVRASRQLSKEPSASLEGTVRLARNPPVPETKFIEASGKAFNTISPGD